MKDVWAQMLFVLTSQPGEGLGQGRVSICYGRTLLAFNNMMI